MKDKPQNNPVREHLIDHGLDVLKHVAAIAIFGALAAGVGALLPPLRAQLVPLYVPVSIALMLLTSIFYCAHLLRKQSPKNSSESYLVVTGRDQVMRNNVELLKARRQVELAEKQRIYSTRVTMWDPKDVTNKRTEFRTELEAAIADGVLVKRLWNIVSPSDARRLLEVVAKHAGQENHSIRAFFNLPQHVIPELLVVNQQAASVSFPQDSHPRKIFASIVAKDRDSIELVQCYFEALFEQAEPVLKSGQPVLDSIDILEKMASAKSH